MHKDNRMLVIATSYLIVKKLQNLLNRRLDYHFLCDFPPKEKGKNEQSRIRSGWLACNEVFISFLSNVL